MADACIVCLGDLRTSSPEDRSEQSLEDGAAIPAPEASKGDDAKRETRSSPKSIDTDDEVIAHLLPCKHDLHNSCLKPWVERANSCPICRATFNVVELSDVVGGPVVSSYAVRDKVQEAELDSTMIVEDELFAVEAWEPCVICGHIEQTHEVMYCDGCDTSVHVFCAGYEDSPDVWYCETCLRDLETDTNLPGLASAATRGARRRGNVPQRRGRRNDAIWARVWQEVSRRLDLDLDFPFDEDHDTPRTAEQQREFARWQRRFEVANQQGTANRLRGIANVNLRSEDARPRSDPESQEELRAWNAFDKARESQEAPSSIRRSRKRKATASPASPRESEPTENRQQKRPRLRRPLNGSTLLQTAESSNTAVRRRGDEPTFLSSLLKEVESKPIAASSPGASDQLNGQFSPRNSSPDLSPMPSRSATPRILSVTPPPQRPISPPLSATIIPITSPLAATFSPFSPADLSQKAHRIRGRPRTPVGSQDGVYDKERASSASPSRSLSYSAKEEIQRMVKLALGPRYREKDINKDQYTDINRDVSRKLYDLVGSASALADQEERDKWQTLANEEVERAVDTLHAVSCPKPAS